MASEGPGLVQQVYELERAPRRMVLGHNQLFAKSSVPFTFEPSTEASIEIQKPEIHVTKSSVIQTEPQRDRFEMCWKGRS